MTGPHVGWRATWPAHRAGILAAALGAATLGLAPFWPHPHIYKQLTNLARGTLTAPIDQFDLLLHGAPWIVLAAALLRWLRARRPRSG